MIYIILIVLIIIVIVYLRYQHFTESDTTSDAINNIVTLFNNDNVNLKNLTVTDNLTINDKLILSSLGGDLMTNLMKIIYPVGSVFLSRKYYDLTDEKSLIDTPLNYGKWLMIQYSEGSTTLKTTTMKTITNEDTDTRTAIYGYGTYTPSGSYLNGNEYIFYLYVYRKISL